MVYSVSIEVFRHLAKTVFPPLESIFSHLIPVIGRESPVLPQDRKIIRRRTRLSVHVEQFRGYPCVGTETADADWYVAFEHNTFVFFVDDPKEIDNIAEQIRGLDLDWGCFRLTVDNTAYEAVASSLIAMQNMITGLIILLIFISIIVLSLILSMWIKQRTREAGILLSIGISKSKIVLQYVIEMLLIAIISFGLSFFSGNAIAQGASNMIFNQVAEEQTVIQPETPDNGTEYLDITGEYSPYELSDIEAVESVSVEVTPQILLLVYLIGAISIIVSVVLSSARIIRMKPKQVLTKMD